MPDRILSDQAKPQPSMAAPSSSAGPPAERTFVGRRAELASLRIGLDVLLRGEGLSFLVCGEAGIGKTRLAAQFSREATAAGVRVVWGRCWEAGGAASYWPWVEVIRALAGPGEAIDLGSPGRFLAQLAPDLADRFGPEGLAAPSPSDPESARFLMFDAVHALLQRSAARGPLAIVIDDLHVADRASLLLLTFLARRSTNLPLLLLGTMRDGETSVSNDLFEPLAEVARHATRIELKGLTTSDISSLLQSEAGAEASADLAARIHDATAGNAFFVDEMLRALSDDASWLSASRSTLETRVPSGVREAIQLRLGRMSTPTVHVLELAAVLGREFDAALIGRALEQATTEVLAALTHAIDLGLIEESPTRIERLQFRHALIRDALYESIPCARRLILHRRVTDTMESLADSAPDRHVGALAHHSLIAAAQGDGRFVKYATHAAQRALARMAFEEAVTLYERTLLALPLAAPDERQRCEILLALAEAKEWANDAAGSRTRFEEAAAIARTLDSTDLLVRAALGVGAIAARKFTATFRCETAPGLLREAMLRVSANDSGSRGKLLSRLALFELTTGSRDAAVNLSTEAIHQARDSKDPSSLVQALTARHAVLLGPDHMEERSSIARELVRIGVERADQETEMRGHALAFTITFELGQMLDARRALARHRTLAEWARDPFELWVNLVWQAALALHEGSFDDAERLSNAAFEFVGKYPGPQNDELYGPISRFAQSILIDEGRGREILDAETAKRFRDRHHEVSTWRVAGLAQLVKLGRLDEVARELATIMAFNLADFERDSFWLTSMSCIAEAIELIGHAQHAAALYEQLLPFAHHNVTSSHLGSRGSVSRYLALLAATLGMSEQAEEHFKAAVDANVLMRARPYTARTRLDWARHLKGTATTSSLERASRLAEEALAEATDLGMANLVSRCSAVVEQITEHAAKWAAQGPLDITLPQSRGVWIVHHGDKQTPVRHCRGMSYVAELLRHPNRDVLALDLIAAAANGPGSLALPAPDREAGRVSRGRSRFVDRIFDARARRDYEARVEALHDELSSAEADGDPGRIMDAQNELAKLERELSRGVGLGGRNRPHSDVERARLSVTRALQVALRRIAEADPEAGRILAFRIRTGTYCCYAEDDLATPNTDQPLTSP